MSSIHEQFWLHERFCLVGHGARKPFPLLSYRALKANGKTVYAVDPSADEVDGDRAYRDLRDVPEGFEAVVLEMPKEETAAWVAKVAEAGCKHLWIHMNRETPEALAIARDSGMTVCTGTCAVQYLRGGFPHVVHRMLRKLSGRW